MSLRPLSIVIPVWDCYVPQLADALESLRADQAVIEQILLVDNASRVELPSALITQPRVTVIKLQQRVSVGAARNAGLAAVSTELVCFFDADDLAEPGMLTELVQVMLRRWQLAALMSSQGDPVTGLRYRFPPEISYGLLRQHKQRQFKWLNLLRPLFSLSGTGVIRTSAIRHSGGFPASSNGEDWAAAASLALCGEIALTERIGRWYDPQPNSLSRSQQSFKNIVARRIMLNRWLLTNPQTAKYLKPLLPFMFCCQLIDVLLFRARR